MKNILIVYAHQEPKSFNGALKDVAVETLTGQGHQVEVSDLYGMRFDPTASKHHFKELQNPDHFNFQDELRNAYDTNTLPEDIRKEINKILAADLINLQFPMYWLGLPAILKGWIDRCFAEHVVFDTDSQKWFDNGPFTHKRLVLSFTTGGTSSYFSQTGLFGDMNVLLWPIQNCLRLTGMQILAPQISHAPGSISEDSRVSMLDSWRNRLETIWTELPLQFVPIKHFEESTGFQLTSEYEEKCREKGYGPTIGQNLGLAISNDSMTKTPKSVHKNENCDNGLKS